MIQDPNKKKSIVLTMKVSQEFVNQLLELKEKLHFSSASRLMRVAFDEYYKVKIKA